VAEVHGQVRETDNAQAVARRRLALAQIRQYPDPALRMAGREVEVFDDELFRLAERMTLLMRDASGVGLAATQVGVLRRMFVFQPADDEAAAVVNPRITHRADEAEVDDEGCLSLQGIQVPVERALSVRLEGKDVGGRDIAFDLEGIGARVAQHELDHLDGVLIIDRTTPEARRGALGVLRPRLVLG
jgi:peptide deformylase